MLNSLEVTTRQGNLLSLPLEEINNGLVVEEIEGLDPVRAILVSSSFAGLDGEQYQSSRREKREIKITLGIDPDETLEEVSDVRRRVYAYFMPKAEVNLKFFFDNDASPVQINGRVESCETPLWAAEPTVIVNIQCFDPDFFDPTEVVVSEETTSGSDEFTIDYDGTVASGLQFIFSADRDIDDFTIYHNPPNETLRTMEFAAPLLDGDVVTINTVAGQKYATLNRLSVDSSIMFGISPQSSWIEMEPGANIFRVYATGDPVPFQIKYFNRYGGL
jgi:hypothetical protein